MLHPDSQNPDLSLRKRQSTLVDVQKQRLRTGNQQKSISRRASMLVRGRSVSRNEAATAVEPNQLETEVQDPEELLAQLSSASAEEITQCVEALKLKAEHMEQQNQAAVRRSYETLVAVSRSIAELPPQLTRLRKQFGDLATIANALRTDALTSQEEDTPSVRQSAPRASMMMLNSAWRQDLVALFRKVEGAQKFLPPIPGRHVVSESSGWYELNAVTWTSTKPVHMFVISDHLLVAQKSSRALTVDHCWALQDIRLAQRDKALQVQSSVGVWAYGAPNAQALEQVTGDLKRSKTSSSHKRTHSRQVSETNTTLSRHTNAAVQEAETAREHARELAQIDLLMAKRDWTGATDLILKSKIPGVEDRRKSLEATLLKLAPKGGKSLGLLQDLGRAEDAIDVYLTERANMIEQRVADVVFRGDIVSHLSQVAVVYFQLIVATVTAFRASFPSAQHAARVVAWTKAQLEAYAEVFNRQLYKIRPGTRVYTQCVEATRCESEQLRHLGLDMDFLLDYVWA